MENVVGEYRKIACPCCGKALPVRILHLEGTLRYSVVCRNCKQKSEVEIREGQSAMSSQTREAESERP